MSAAIVQKTSSTSTSSSIYFECGDIFSATAANAAASKSNEKHEKQNNISSFRTNGSNLSEINGLDLDNSSNSLDQKEKLEHFKNNDQYRYHNALTRTASQPQPQKDANVATLVTTMIENLGNINLHRKLERTQSEPLPQQVNTSRYKTELCRPFEEAGECKYGDKCQFAHGYHELRNLQRHPKYKTEYCRTFHSVGFCPYGPRCHFVHNADEARAMQQLQQPKLATGASNHSNYNCISSYPLTAKQAATAAPNTAAGNTHSLPLSPPLSMSTGSDRESPTGSLSISPTNSMTNFPFGDQVSPANSVFQTAFPYVNTPPDSPNAPISPVNTPPPTIVLSPPVQTQTQTLAQAQPQPMYIKPVTNIPCKQVLQKSSSSPITIIRNNVSVSNKTPTKVNSVSSLTGVGIDDARLPVFNRLSSAVDKSPNVAL